MKFLLQPLSVKISKELFNLKVSHILLQIKSWNLHRVSLGWRGLQVSWNQTFGQSEMYFCPFAIQREFWRHSQATTWSKHNELSDFNFTKLIMFFWSSSNVFNKFLLTSSMIPRFNNIDCLNYLRRIFKPKGYQISFRLYHKLSIS